MQGTQKRAEALFSDVASLRPHRRSRVGYPAVPSGCGGRLRG
uniref:Uncharacterized protein n=1 Tax=Chloracidobacterium thermophilum TaxID=458033 RepID=A8DJF7_9BACT|nr:conserved hypothetical protein [Chloracidobacterium thermophilum]